MERLSVGWQELKNGKMESSTDVHITMGSLIFN